MSLKRSFHRGDSIFAVSLSLLALVLQPGSFAQPSLAVAASSPTASFEQPGHEVSRANPIVAALDALSDSAEAIFTSAQAGKMDRSRKNLDSLVASRIKRHVFF